jgi:hypothetical protein
LLAAFSELVCRSPKIESLMGMEPLFNLVWVLVASAGVWFWFKRGRRTRKGESSSLVGLAMLAVMLFPVISVSDDLWSLQNPAERDTCQRRDHSDGHFQPHFPATPALTEPIGAELSFPFRRLDMPHLAELTASINPAFGFIENRPPPVF